MSYGCLVPNRREILGATTISKARAKPSHLQETSCKPAQPPNTVKHESLEVETEKRSPKEKLR